MTRLGLAMLSLSVILFEIALTRLASVLITPALTFVVIAGCIAAAGLGAAFVHQRQARAARTPGPALLAWAATGTALGALAALVSVVLSPAGFALGLFALPFLAFGAYAAAAYRLLDRPPLTYAADLLGGAMGALAAPFALRGMGDVATALFGAAVAAAAGLIVSRGRPGIARGMLLALPALALALQLALPGGLLEVDPFATFGFRPHLVAQTRDRGGRVVATAHDSFARTDLVETDEPGVRYLFTDRMHTARVARWDGRSERFEDPELLRLSLLKGLAFRALRPRRVLVLGAGGGFDVALALQSGARRVDAVEVNAAMIRFTRELGDFAGRVYDRPDVRVVHAEARRFLARSRDRYDLVSLSLMQTDPAKPLATTGFQSWVFTLEAVREYLDHLEPGGVLAIVQNNEAIARKTAATLLASLERHGLATDDALRRLAVLSLPDPGRNPFAHLLLLGRDPLGPAQTGSLAGSAEAAGIVVRHLPGHASLASSMRVADTLPTDERPYFYELGPALPLLLALTGGGAAALLLIVAGRDLASRRGLPGAGWLTASLLGAAFMLLESGLLQRSQFLLGEPTVAVTAVVAGMLVGAGAGSLLSGRLAWPPGRRLAVGAGLAAAVALAEAAGWPALEAALRAWQTPGLAAVVLALVALPAVPAGFCLPACLERFACSGGAAAIYGANALASVVGASAATLLAMRLGTRTLFVAAAAGYLASLLPARRRSAEVRGGVELLARLSRHAPADPEEREDLARILRFVAAHPDPFDRRIPEGHLTGSAVVIAAAGDRVLLVRHRKLERWLQPGGHADPGEHAGEDVALREAHEETGIEGLALHPAASRPLDVDVHDIPARGEQPAHEHLDLRYLVVAPDGAAARPDPDESHQLGWFRWDELARLDLDAGLVRALAKARAAMARR